MSKARMKVREMNMESSRERDDSFSSRSDRRLQRDEVVRRENRHYDEGFSPSFRDGNMSSRGDGSTREYRHTDEWFSSSRDGNRSFRSVDSRRENRHADERFSSSRDDNRSSRGVDTRSSRGDVFSRRDYEFEQSRSARRESRSPSSELYSRPLSSSRSDGKGDGRRSSDSDDDFINVNAIRNRNSSFIDL